MQNFFVHLFQNNEKMSIVFRTGNCFAIFLTNWKKNLKLKKFENLRKKRSLYRSFEVICLVYND